MAEHPLFRAWIALRCHRIDTGMDVRALAWLGGDIKRPELFRVERLESGRWVELQ